MNHIQVSMNGGADVFKVAWPRDGTTDKNVEELIGRIVGVPHDQYLLVDLLDGSFVPACTALPTGSSYRLAPTPNSYFKRAELIQQHLAANVSLVMHKLCMGNCLRQSSGPYPFL